MAVKTSRLKLTLTSGRFTNENGETYIGYGFTAYRNDPPREVFRIEDLSVDADKVRELMRLILDNNVDEKHLPDLIEDFCV